MRIGIWNVSATALLGLAITFIIKDLTVPLTAFALLGVLDRLVGSRFAR